jgi:hypothetical protein
MKLARPIAAAAFSLALGGTACASVPHASAPWADMPAGLATSPPRGAPSLAAACPAAVRGVRLSTADVPGGEAIRYDAPDARVSEVRARASKMAAVFREHGAVAVSRDLSEEESVAATAAEGDVPRGAVVVFRAVHPNDVDLLRAAVTRHAGRTAAMGGCPISEGAGGLVASP